MNYCWLVGISGGLVLLGVVVLLAAKAEFYYVRIAYWCSVVGTGLLAAILIGGLVQHILLQVRGK